MTRYLVYYIIALICGIILGFHIAINFMLKRASDGTCIRTEDGEVYLRVSEEGQKKLSDPTTKLLWIRVIDIATRNNQLL